MTFVRHLEVLVRLLPRSAFSFHLKILSWIHICVRDKNDLRRSLSTGAPKLVQRLTRNLSVGTYLNVFQFGLFFAGIST